MPTSSTPVAEFHAAIRAELDDEDQEVHSAYKITEKIKLVVNTGQIPGYRISGDGSSVEPALKPDTNQVGYALLIKKTALMFRRSLSKDHVFDLKAEVYRLENGEMCGS